MAIINGNECNNQIVDTVGNDVISSGKSDDIVTIRYGQDIVTGEGGVGVGVDMVIGGVDEASESFVIYRASGSDHVGAGRWRCAEPDQCSDLRSGV